MICRLAMMNVQILCACEHSQAVTLALRRYGLSAFSCDILPAMVDPSIHFKCDCFEVIEKYHPQVVIAFPPCTYLTKANSDWSAARYEKMLKALEFVKALYESAPCVAIENPVGKLSTLWRPPDCIVNPTQFGDDRSKVTCFWLKNLPPLIPSMIPLGHFKSLAFSHSSSFYRSLLSPFLAEAMAFQWFDTIKKYVAL